MKRKVGRSRARASRRCYESANPAMFRLLFADEKGVVYDHPDLLAAARTGGDVVRPSGRPIPLPEGGGSACCPGGDPWGSTRRPGNRSSSGRSASVAGPSHRWRWARPCLRATPGPCSRQPPVRLSGRSAPRSSRSGPTPPPPWAPRVRWPGRSTPTGGATGIPGTIPPRTCPGSWRNASPEPTTRSTGSSPAARSSGPASPRRTPSTGGTREPSRLRRPATPGASAASPSRPRACPRRATTGSSVRRPPRRWPRSARPTSRRPRAGPWSASARAAKASPCSAGRRSPGPSGWSGSGPGAAPST